MLSVCCYVVIAVAVEPSWTWGHTRNLSTEEAEAEESEVRAELWIYNQPLSKTHESPVCGTGGECKMSWAW